MFKITLTFGAIWVILSSVLNAFPLTASKTTENRLKMDGFIKTLYESGIVSDGSVNEYIEKRNADDKLLKALLTACGLTRKIIPWDRNSLENWRRWNFSDEMLFEAAKLSAGKANPMAYINGILSSWKKDGIFEVTSIATEDKSIQQNKINYNKNKRPSLLEQWQSTLEAIDENKKS